MAMASYGTRRRSFTREHRKRFAQAERSAQILAQFEQGLRFLPRRRDRGQESGFLAWRVLDR